MMSDFVRAIGNTTTLSIILSTFDDLQIFEPCYD